MLHTTTPLTSFIILITLGIISFTQVFIEHAICGRYFLGSEESTVIKKRRAWVFILLRMRIERDKMAIN